MWLSKLKNKKVQNFLLGIIIVISMVVVSVSTVLTVLSSNFAEKYYEGDKTPDILCITTKDSVIKKVDNFYKSKRDTVRNYNNKSIFSISTNLSFNGENNSALMSYVVPIENIDNISNKLEIKEGNKNSKAPKEGEMWISSTTANLRKIKVGDIAKIINTEGKSTEYKISGIVNDSNQSSTTMGILFVYVNEAERLSLKGLPEAKILTFNCDEDNSKVSADLLKYINEPLGGVIVDKTSFILSSTMTLTITGGISTTTALMLIVVLILIVRSNIKNNISKEFKAIGIYKAMGYSSSKIINIYAKMYITVSVVSSLLGILIAIPTIDYICNIAFKNLGTYKFDVTAISIIIIEFLVFNLLVYINVVLVLSKIKKIKPVEAIDIGITSTKEKLKKSIIKNNSSSIAMAVNDIYKYKKSNFIILMVLTLVFYISTFFLNMAYTMVNLESDLYKIFGTANSDLVITAPSDIKNSIADIEKYISLDKRVKDCYFWDVEAVGKVSIDIKKYKVEGGTLMATIYNKFNEDDFSIIKGVNPRNKNEVSLSIALMKNNSLEIGDYIDIKVNDTEKRFLIVGEYSSMMSNGQSIRVTSDAVDENSIGNVAFIKLNSIKDYESLREDINDKYKGLKVEKNYGALQDAASQVVETVVPIAIVLLIGTLVFGIFNIVNILIVNNIDNRKNYGIMKSLGFTSSYIRERNNFRVMLLAMGAAVIGTLGMLLSIKDICKITMGFDLAKINLPLTLGLVMTIFILILITLHICNKSIKKISTVELIKE